MTHRNIMIALSHSPKHIGCGTPLSFGDSGGIDEGIGWEEGSNEWFKLKIGIC